MTVKLTKCERRLLDWMSRRQPLWMDRYHLCRTGFGDFTVEPATLRSLIRKGAVTVEPHPLDLSGAWYSVTKQTEDAELA